MMNGKKFDMQRIDDKQKLGNVEYCGTLAIPMTRINGMVHPTALHGTQIPSCFQKQPWALSKWTWIKVTEVAPEPSVWKSASPTRQGLYEPCHHWTPQLWRAVSWLKSDPDHPKTIQEINGYARCFNECVILKNVASRLKISIFRAWICKPNSCERTRAVLL